MDGKDLENNSVYTEDDENDYGEEGELDLEDEYNNILLKLDPETRERFENGEMDEEEMRSLGLLNGDNDYGEEGENEISESELAGANGDAAADSDDDDDDDDEGDDGEAPTKQQKTD